MLNRGHVRPLGRVCCDSRELIWCQACGRGLAGKLVYLDIGRTARIARYAQIADGTVEGSHGLMVGGERDEHENRTAVGEWKEFGCLDHGCIKPSRSDERSLLVLQLPAHLCFNLILLTFGVR